MTKIWYPHSANRRANLAAIKSAIQVNRDIAAYRCDASGAHAVAPSYIRAPAGPRRWHAGGGGAVAPYPVQVEHVLGYSILLHVGYFICMVPTYHVKDLD